LKAEEALALGIVSYVEEDYEAAYKKALEISEKILKNVNTTYKIAHKYLF